MAARPPRPVPGHLTAMSQSEARRKPGGPRGFSTGPTAYHEQKAPGGSPGTPGCWAFPNLHGTLGGGHARSPPASAGGLYSTDTLRPTAALATTRSPGRKPGDTVSMPRAGPAITTDAPPPIDAPGLATWAEARGHRVVGRSRICMARWVVVMPGVPRLPPGASIQRGHRLL